MAFLGGTRFICLGSKAMLQPDEGVLALMCVLPALTFLVALPEACAKTRGQKQSLLPLSSLRKHHARKQMSLQCHSSARYSYSRQYKQTVQADTRRVPVAASLAEAVAVNHAAEVSAVKKEVAELKRALHAETLARREALTSNAAREVAVEAVVTQTASTQTPADMLVLKDVGDIAVRLGAAQKQVLDKNRLLWSRLQEAQVHEAELTRAQEELEAERQRGWEAQEDVGVVRLESEAALEIEREAAATRLVEMQAAASLAETEALSQQAVNHATELAAVRAVAELQVAAVKQEVAELRRAMENGVEAERQRATSRAAAGSMAAEARPLASPVAADVSHVESARGKRVSMVTGCKSNYSPHCTRFSDRLSRISPHCFH